ncbi:MAG: HAD-IIIC family phosphatase [Bacteroidetes bacterium]|nr:HAD-IIIC family phosphatase [Bacteroidota bacterium]
MLSFNELKIFYGKKTKSNSVPVKIALLTDSSTQLLAQAITGFGVFNDCDYELWQADYNQIDLQIYDNNSALYKFKPDYIIVLRSSEHLLNTFYKTGVNVRENFAAVEINRFENLIQTISANTTCKIITNTYPEINDAVFGNYAAKVVASFIYQIRKLNLSIMDLAQQHENLLLLDMASLVAEKGYCHSFDSKLYVTADMVYNLEILPVIAQNIHSIIQAAESRFKKCLIVDLDNTLWGGVIGDDGLEGIQIGNLGIGKAFSEFQLWIKELKQRGIIIAVCSKNTEAVAKEPFEKHPDMELRLDDIALFVANWESKADNIKHIQQILQIGFDSMVFLDDNIFEREMVRKAIPEVTIPDLPEDPVDYLMYLRTLNLFETASFINEDEGRTKQYQEEAKRVVFQKTFEAESDFLKNLEMVSEISSFNSFSIPRIAQLCQRSNQFNLRTQRYTETELKQLTENNDYFTLSFSLADKFGNHGLIAAIILKKENKNTLFIENWIMSCRVLTRGMEQFSLHAITQLACKNKFSMLKGEYLPTTKNGLVKDHYLKLGFNYIEGFWQMNLNESNFINQTYIQPK